MDDSFLIFTGVSILSGVEDVQQMLDDHILKAQTMHSSAYIKPFEEEMKDWEDKLISMQVNCSGLQTLYTKSFLGSFIHLR